jgi:hypothetical protein
MVSESSRFSAPASSATTSSGVSVKSKMSMFWASRSRFDDLGIGTSPSSMFQRSTTCAGILPYVAPIVARVCLDRSHDHWRNGVVLERSGAQAELRNIDTPDNRCYHLENMFTSVEGSRDMP